MSGNIIKSLFLCISMYLIYVFLSFSLDREKEVFFLVLAFHKKVPYSLIYWVGHDVPT